MSYNTLTGLALLGALILTLGVTIVLMERKARRYAVPELDKEKIRMHQRIRRLENGL